MSRGAKIAADLAPMQPDRPIVPSGFGFDRVTDLTEGEDAILLDGLTRWDGTAVNDGADLDTNGDGTVGYGDESVFVTAAGTMLLFDEGTVMLEGLNGVAVDDFVFP